MSVSAVVSKREFDRDAFQELLGNRLWARKCWNRALGRYTQSAFQEAVEPRSGQAHPECISGRVAVQEVSDFRKCCISGIVGFQEALHFRKCCIPGRVGTMLWAGPPRRIEFRNEDVAFDNRCETAVGQDPAVASAIQETSDQDDRWETAVGHDPAAASATQENQETGIQDDQESAQETHQEF